MVFFMSVSRPDPQLPADPPSARSMRLFIALHIPPTAPIRRVLNRLASFGSVLRPTDRDAMHLTLRFLGQTDAHRLAGLRGAVDEAAATSPPLTLHLRGLGRFDPNPRRPLRVIYAGIEPPEPVVRLGGALADALARLQPPLPPEDRPLRPHLTLARVKRKPPPALLRLLEEHAETDFGEARVTAVYLLSSQLTRSGAIYTTEHTAALKGPA